MRVPRRALPLGLYACIACAAAPAAAVTSPANSTIPSQVMLVGRAGTQADTAFGNFTIVARDAANNPEAGKLIEFRVLNCSGARLAADQLQPGVATRCATHGITATTDITGSVRMAVLGGGTPGAATSTGPCAQVYSGGALLGSVRVAYPDLDGDGGVGINDLALWLWDFGRAESISRSDLDGDDDVDVDDMSLWMEVWARAGSVEGAASYCL